MSDPAIALLMLGLFICFIFLGFPIAFTLMAMGVGFGFYAYFNPAVAFWDNNIFFLSRTEHFQRDEQRRAHFHPAVSVHGLHH
jgi:TRAP-type mannitol/chloroaromatic compound transport system permease large subunit